MFAYRDISNVLPCSRMVLGEFLWGVRRRLVGVPSALGAGGEVVDFPPEQIGVFVAERLGAARALVDAFPGVLARVVVAESVVVGVGVECNVDKPNRAEPGHVVSWISGWLA